MYSKKHSELFQELYRNALSRKYELGAGSKNGNQTWVPSDKDTLVPIIEAAENAGYIHPGEHVLELGSGDMTAGLMWAICGYHVIGVELDARLVEISKKNIEKYKSILPTEISIAVYQGNYLPKDIESCLDGYARAIDTRYSDMLGFGPAENREKRQKIFAQMPTSDVYEENGIDLKSIDTFFGYFYAPQVTKVGAFFKHYARDDAKLLAYGPYASIILGKLGLKELQHKNESLNVHVKN